MRLKTSPSILLRLAALVAAGVLLVGATPPGVGAATPVFTPVAAESELVRLLNLERTRAGLPTLAIDVFLAQRARDGNVPCPADPTKVMAGRADDLAANWSPASSVDPHLLRLCPKNTILDTMYARWGYSGGSGEIFAWNAGYSMNPLSYPSDCGVEGLTGPCYDTAPATVSVAATGWMESPGHRAIVLGNYDRFGCGAATAADGSHDFVCIFSMGGRTVPADTTSPTLRARSYWHAGRTIHTSARFADAGGLRRICLLVDGHTKTCLNTAGRKTVTRAWTGRLTRGRHVVAWRATDLAGNTRTTTLAIRLR